MTSSSEQASGAEALRRSVPAGGGGPGRIRLEPCRAAATWDELARRCAGGTAFHRWDFLDLQERMLGVVIERLLAVDDDDGRPVGIVPLAKRGAVSIRSPYLPFPLLGPAVELTSVLAVLNAVRRRQRRTGFVLAHFDVAAALTPEARRAAPDAGMRVQVDGTVQVDLSHGSVERLDEVMGRTRRKQVRQALRAGVSARAAQPGETSAMLGRVLDAAYGARGIENPYPADAGEQIEQWAAGRDDVRLGAAFVGEQHVGLLVTLAGHSISTAWVGSCLPESRSVHAESVLLRDGMIWAMEQGSTVFDFAGRVNDDVERYKLSFGGTAEPYVTVESFLGPHVVREVLGRL